MSGLSQTENETTLISKIKIDEAATLSSTLGRNNFMDFTTVIESEFILFNRSATTSTQSLNPAINLTSSFNEIRNSTSSIGTTKILKFSSPASASIATTSSLYLAESTSNSLINGSFALIESPAVSFDVLKLIGIGTY